MKKLTALLNPKSVTFRLFLWIFALWLPFSVVVIGSLWVISMKQLDNTIRNQKENISYFSAIVNDDLDRVTPVSYTHLDVYKRQGVSVHVSAQKSARRSSAFG